MSSSRDKDLPPSPTLSENTLVGDPPTRSFTRPTSRPGFDDPLPPTQQQLLSGVQAYVNL